MGNIVYLDGKFVYDKFATTHITDRGYQFADAAYEVVLYINGQAVDLDPHLDRLERTLSEVEISMPFSKKALILNIQTLLQKNYCKNGLVYIQISRGIAPRNHATRYNIKPFIVMTVKPVTYHALCAQRNKVISVTLIPDQRWGRCDLKTVGLLPNIMAMHQAIDNGFDDALLYDSEGITEGTSWNFWIINSKGNLQTRPLDNHILWGITRQTIQNIANKKNIQVIEKAITFDDLKFSSGAFATSASKFVMAINRIDDIYFENTHPIIADLFDAYVSLFPKD